MFLFFQKKYPILSFSFVLGGSFAPITYLFDTHGTAIENKKYHKVYLKEIMELINKYEIEKWDGFNQYDPDVLDGTSFSLKIKYRDGRVIYARGENSFPEHYHDFYNEFNLLINIIEKRI